MKKRYRLKKKVKIFLVIFALVLAFSLIIPQTWAKFAQSINKKIRVSISTSRYTIVFNGNGSTSGSTASVECIYGQDCDLTLNGFVRDGYEFIGWATSPNGEVVYDDEDTVNSLVLSGNYDLYAKWIGILNVTETDYIGIYDGQPHTFTINGDGGTIMYGATQGNYVTTTQPTVTEVGSYLTYYQVTKEGYRTVEGIARIFIGAVTLNDTTYFTTLHAAVDAVNPSGSSNIKVYKDLSEGAFNFTNLGSTVINLQNHTLSYDESAQDNYFISNEDTVVFTNGSIESSIPTIRNKNNAVFQLLNVDVTSTGGTAIVNDFAFYTYGGNFESTSASTIVNNGTYIIDSYNNSGSTELGIVTNSVDDCSAIVNNGQLTLNGARVYSNNYNAIVNRSGKTIIDGDSEVIADSSSGSDIYPAIVNSGGEIQLDDGTVSGGKIAIYSTAANGVVTVNGGTISGGDREAIFMSAGELNISGTPVIETQSASHHAIFLNNENPSDTVSLTMNGGTVEGQYGAILMEGTASALIESGTFIGHNYSTITILDSATVEITDVDVSSENSTGIACVGSGHLQINGGTVLSNSNALYNNGCVMDVSSGSYTSTSSNAVFIEAGQTNFEGDALAHSSYFEKPAIGVEGGIFNMSGGTAESIYGAIKVKTGGTANITDGTLKILSGAAQPYSVVQNEGVTTLSGAELINPLTSSMIDNEGTITIENIEITHSLGEVLNNESGTATIRNSAVLVGLGNNKPTVDNKAGATLIASGGTITSTDSNAIVNKGVAQLGNSLTVESTNVAAIQNAASGVMTLTGTTVNSTSNSLVNLGEVTITSTSHLSSTGSSKPTFVNYNGGTATVESGTIDSQSYAIWNQDGGELSVEGGNISSSASFALYNQGEATLDGGSFSSIGSNVISNFNVLNMNTGTSVTSQDSTYPAVANNSGGTLVVNGASIDATATALLVKGNSVATVTSGTLHSDESAAIDVEGDGDVTINGGTLTSDEVALYVMANGHALVTNGQLSSSSGNAINDKGTVEITGPVNISSQSTTSTVINVASTGQLTMSNGTITATNNNGIINSGSTTITGGTLIGSANGYPVVQNHGTLSVSGGSISSETSNGIVNVGTASISGTANIATTGSHPAVAITDGTLTMSGGRVTSESYSVYALDTGKFNMTGGTVDGACTYALYVISEATVSGGTIKNTNGLAVRSDGTTNITGGTIDGSANAINVLGGTTTISGTAVVTARGSSSPAVIAQSGGTVNVGGSASITGISYGLWVQSGGTGKVTGGTIYSSAALGAYNQGTITISGGSISSTEDAGFYNAGTATISGGTIESSGTYSFYNASGTTTMTAGTIIQRSGQAAYVGTGSTFTVNGGSVTGATNAALVYGTLNVGGTANITGQGSTSPAVIAMNGGRVNVSGGNITGASYGLWVQSGGIGSVTGGIVNSTGSHGVYNSGTVTISSNADVRSSGLAGLYNASSATISGGKVSSSGDVAVNQAGGTLNIAGGTIESSASAGLYTTAGTISINGGAVIRSTATGSIPAYYINGGTHTIRTCTVEGPYGLYVAGGSPTLDLYPGAVFKASVGTPTTYGSGSTNIHGGSSTSSSGGWTITTIT